jgi:gentisate 1,2-dioxygenase
VSDERDGDSEDVGLASVLGQWDDRRQRAAKGIIHIKGSEQQWELNRQGRCRFYTHLGRSDLANPDWICFRHEIHTHSGVHVHQGGLALLVTRGQGYTVCDGRRADWKEGDVILLPIEPGGVEHQHFNVGDEPCEWVAFAFNPWLDAMGNGYEQRQNHPDYKDDLPATGSVGTDRRRTPSQGHRRGGAEVTLYEALLARRDAERVRRAEALLVVDGEAEPWEDSPQGRLRWYLHPDLTGRALQTMGLYVQEIGPHSRSGRYRWQGGEMIVCLEGRGVTEVDGEQFEWEAGDALAIPVREAGVELCHHNRSDEPARFVCAWPNLPAVLGVDMGSGLEQLENAPDPGR